MVKEVFHTLTCLSTLSGTFSYRFNTPGVYYYSSGYIDDTGVKILQGVVTVNARQDESMKISVRVGGVEANYVTGGNCGVDQILSLQSPEDG